MCVCCRCVWSSWSSCMYSVCIKDRHTFRNSHTCPQHSGRDSDSLPSSPGTDTTLLSQQSGSVGDFGAVHPSIQPSYALPLPPPAGHPLAFSFAVALHLPLPQLIDLYSTLVGCCHIQSMAPASIY